MDRLIFFVRLHMGETGSTRYSTPSPSLILYPSPLWQTQYAFYVSGYLSYYHTYPVGSAESLKLTSIIR